MAAVWRRILLALCAAASVAFVATLIDEFGAGGAPWFGFWYTQFAASSAPYHVVVASVDPDGPGGKAGLRRGDLIDIRGNSILERFGIISQPLAGRPIALSVSRGSQHIRVVVVPQTDARRWDVEAATTGVLLLVLFAALILWRRPLGEGNLLLAAVLVCFAIGTIELPNFGSFGSPWAWQYILAAVCSPLLPLSVAIWARYASRFAAPLSRARRFAHLTCYACAGIAGALNIAWVIGMVTLHPDPVGLALSPVWALPLDATIFMALLCGIMAIAASHGADRQRAVWSFVPLAVLYVVFVAYATIVVTAPTNEISNLSGIILNVTYFFTPLTLTYLALSRRLIDVGFILNQAAVFAIVSTIVVGAFVLVEWAASEWLVNASHATSAIVGGIVALVLGFSMRFIHRYVDHFVDNSFFRKRHEDERALRRFAHESSFISDRELLLERALENVKAHTAASDAAIFLHGGAAGYVQAMKGRSTAVSENDPAIVQLRAWGKTVLLHDVERSAINGELAFPMISRGTLVGALVCGPKRDGEAYAPDETDALFTLAHGVATALDTLSHDSAVRVESRIEEQILEKLDEIARKLDFGVASAGER
ncbi:MAG: hypothetical protein WB609_14320 [Candidatus Cybelea sp.]